MFLGPDYKAVIEDIALISRAGILKGMFALSYNRSEHNSENKPFVRSTLADDFALIIDSGSIYSVEGFKNKEAMFVGNISEKDLIAKIEGLSSELGWNVNISKIAEDIQNKKIKIRSDDGGW